MSELQCFEFASMDLPSRHPFEKVLSLGWYDGTTTGVVLCKECSTAFKYDLIAWDSDQDHRVFAFSPIDIQEIDHLVDLLCVGEDPSWPFWNPKWKFESREEKERIAIAVNEHLSRGGPIDYVAESDRLLETIYGVKRISKPERDMLPGAFNGYPVTDDFEFWWKFIGQPGAPSVPQPE